MLWPGYENESGLYIPPAWNPPHVSWFWYHPCKDSGPISCRMKQWMHIFIISPLPRVAKYGQIVHWMQVNIQGLWSFIPSLLPLSLAAKIEHSESASCFYSVPRLFFHLTIKGCSRSHVCVSGCAQNAKIRLSMLCQLSITQTHITFKQVGRNKCCLVVTLLNDCVSGIEEYACSSI